jgi:hypothetical protein
LALVFAAAAAGMVAGCVKSDVAAPSATRAAPTGVVTSGLGGIAGEVCEATGASFADVVGAAACFDALGAKTDSVVTFGIGGPLGSINFVPTNTDATPSAITAPVGSDHLRTTSTVYGWIGPRIGAHAVATRIDHAALRGGFPGSSGRGEIELRACRTVASAARKLVRAAAVVGGLNA